jgi:hypothetical protein
MRVEMIEAAVPSKEIKAPELRRSESHYLRGHAVRQIDLFNLLATRVPLVGMATSIANEMLLGAMPAGEDAVLLDVGIGTGRQMIELLRALGDSAAQPAALTIIGVEPERASLISAEKGILQESERLNLKVKFQSIHCGVEKLTASDLDFIRSLGRNIVINSAFSLHHVPFVEGVGSPDLPDLKDKALSDLRSLNPRALVLSEPDSDHETSDDVARARNCWRHFGLTFDLIDACELTEEEKNAIKGAFFAREIQDILGEVNALRTERHETTAMWLARLKRAGFQIGCRPLEYRGPIQAPVSVSEREGFLGLDFNGSTIVSIIGVSTGAPQ